MKTLGLDIQVAWLYSTYSGATTTALGALNPDPMAPEAPDPRPIGIEALSRERNLDTPLNKKTEVVDSPLWDGNSFLMSVQQVAQKPFHANSPFTRIWHFLPLC